MKRALVVLTWIGAVAAGLSAAVGVPDIVAAVLVLVCAVLTILILRAREPNWISPVPSWQQPPPAPTTTVDTEVVEGVVLPKELER